MGFTPFGSARLANAIKAKDHTRLDALLTSGVDPALRPSGTYHAPIEIAVACGNIYALKRLMAQPDILDRSGVQLKSLFARAVCENHIDVAAFLLRRAKDEKRELLGCRQYNGDTPLHLAARYDLPRMADFLLQTGADAAATNKEGDTPRRVAEVRGHVRVIDLLDNDRQKKQSASYHAENGWKKLSGERIAYVQVDAEIGYRLLDIFNFETREVRSINVNLATKAESSSARSFDDIADRSRIDAALAELQRRGGKTESTAINRLRKP